MIQDIGPDRLDNAFAQRTPQAEDHILYFSEDGKLPVRIRDGGIRFTTGDEVSFTFDPSLCHLFDKTSEKNLI